MFSMAALYGKIEKFTIRANFKTLRFHPSKEGPGVIFVIKRMVNVKKSIDEL